MHITNDTPCPCGSEKRAGSCCIRLGPVVRADGTRLTERRLEVPQATLHLEGPKTGRRVTGCYAADLDDCDGPLTDEHPVSHRMLKQLAGESARLRVLGIDPKDPDLVKVLPTKRIAARVLCKRHNRALMPIDTVANRFFDNVSSLSERLTGVRETTLQVVAINGHDLERWCLKVLCGFMARDNLPIPELWPRILFGGCSILAPFGLYIFAEVGDTLIGEDIQFESVRLDGRDVGAIVRILNHELIFSMHRIGPMVLERHQQRPVLYRPGAFAYRNPMNGRELGLVLSWQDDRFHSHVESTWTPPAKAT